MSKCATILVDAITYGRYKQSLYTNNQTCAHSKGHDRRTNEIGDRALACTCECACGILDSCISYRDIEGTSVSDLIGMYVQLCGACICIQTHKHIYVCSLCREIETDINIDIVTDTDIDTETEIGIEIYVDLDVDSM